MITLNDCLSFFKENEKQCVFCNSHTVTWEKKDGFISILCRRNCFFITYDPTIRDDKIIGIFSGMKAEQKSNSDIYTYSVIYFNSDNEFMLNIKKNNLNFITKKYNASSFEEFISYVANKHANIQFLG